MVFGRRQIIFISDHLETHGMLYHVEAAVARNARILSDVRSQRQLPDPALVIAFG